MDAIEFVFSQLNEAVWYVAIINGIIRILLRGRGAGHLYRSDECIDLLRLKRTYNIRSLCLEITYKLILG